MGSRFSESGAIEHDVCKFVVESQRIGDGDAYVGKCARGFLDEIGDVLRGVAPRRQHIGMHGDFGGAVPHSGGNALSDAGFSEFHMGEVDDQIGSLRPHLRAGRWLRRDEIRDRL